MTYAETISYLSAAAPLFQQVGGAAYKEGLTTTETLDRHFSHPHRQFRTVHVAGTNGKGSCAHTLAAMLQHRGLKVGLYTSPHLIDFRERIRVNGTPVPEQYVVDFVAREKDFFEPLHPSFFELTTAMAFCYFAEAGVDVAVVEVGLGGRLDCTNIIRPELSIVTNISLDHTQFLGETLPEIAREKAGIMKRGVPALVGEALPETRPVFEAQAATVGAPLSFAQDTPEILSSERTPEGLRRYETRHWGTFLAQLSADCQVFNTETLLHAAALLRPAFGITEEDVHYAFRHVCEATGLMGRWQTLRTRPLTVCDTGHNLGGWQYLSHQLREAIGSHPAASTARPTPPWPKPTRQLRPAPRRTISSTSAAAVSWWPTCWLRWLSRGGTPCSDPPYCPARQRMAKYLGNVCSLFQKSRTFGLKITRFSICYNP